MSKTQMVGAIAFTTLAVALVLGISVLGVNDSATPFVTSILGFIGLAVAQLVGAAKAENTENKVNELNASLHNGTFRRLLKEALTEIAADAKSTLNIDDPGKEDETK